MQQSRHPNILLYLGLCLAPPPPEESLTDNGTSRSTRILIISEYVPRGNLRQYILDRTLPFPWRLRMSFSIDVARALSYLHASPRNCMHRDLKGENLLVTENERIKICDFGLARVVDEVSGSAEMQRSRPLTYCGTDGCELDFSLFVSFRRLTDFSLLTSNRHVPRDLTRRTLHALDRRLLPRCPLRRNRFSNSHFSTPLRSISSRLRTRPRRSSFLSVLQLSQSVHRPRFTLLRHLP